MKILSFFPKAASAPNQHADDSMLSAMDQRIPAKRGKASLWIGIALLSFIIALLALWLGWQNSAQTLRVSAQEIELAKVQRGLFRDDVLVRATALARESVLLDARDGGRVEQIAVKDGALVKQGELLFQLSNQQRQLDLLARQAEYAQQLSNLSNLRVALENTRSDLQRREREQEFAQAQALKQVQRNRELQAQGFIAEQVRSEAEDKLALQQHLLQDLKKSSITELAIRQAAVEQMAALLQRLQTGLQLQQNSLQALEVRAPRAGRLLDFHLQLGEIVKPEQHLGRIDDAQLFKLSAQLDEFYLNRITLGNPVSVNLQGQTYAAKVSRILSQIKDGRFGIEIEFTSAQPELSAGRSLDAVIKLGEASSALLLPNAAFMLEGGGAWVFVLGHDQARAQRRQIKVGRRNSSQVEILAGLQEGEQVIISSYSSFGNAQQLRLSYASHALHRLPAPALGMLSKNRLEV